MSVDHKINMIKAEQVGCLSITQVTNLYLERKTHCHVLSIRVYSEARLNVRCKHFSQTCNVVDDGDYAQRCGPSYGHGMHTTVVMRYQLCRVSA